MGFITLTPCVPRYGRGEEEKALEEAVVGGEVGETPAIIPLS